MQTQIVLGKIARATAHFVELHQSSGFHRHSRANRRLVALRANQLEQDAMIWAISTVQQQRRRLANIENDNVHVAVIVDISESCAPPGLWWHLRQSRRNVVEGTIAMVAE